jgi:hypothetical protein
MRRTLSTQGSSTPIHLPVSLAGNPAKRTEVGCRRRSAVDAYEVYAGGFGGDLLG